jgi:anti-sigma factor RsiW
MRCEHFEERLSSHLDGMLDDRSREDVLNHMEVCGACEGRWKSMREARSKLRRLERPRIPAVLAVQLRVLASHERARRLARATFSVRLRNWKDTFRLNFENLMRPVALPVAGGVLSAMLLFSALIPNLVFRHPITNDPPLSFSGPQGIVRYWSNEIPRLEPLDAVVSSDENVVELTIDNEGRVVDYDVRQGQLTPDGVSIILLSRFTPAMFFGKPTWGKTLVVLPGHPHRSARG